MIDKTKLIPLTQCEIKNKSNIFTLFYADEKLEVFNNDKICHSIDVKIKNIDEEIGHVDLGASWYFKTHLGHMVNTQNFYEAKLYSLRIYSKKHDLDSIIHSRHQNVFSNSTIVKAKLIQKSYAPKHNEVLPYKKVLMLNKYELQKPILDQNPASNVPDLSTSLKKFFFNKRSDTFYEGKVIGVAEWSLLNKEMTENSKKIIGKIYDLKLLPFDKINKLEQEYVSDTIEDSYNLEVFYANN